ncbi:MAG: hypothetical protein HY476_00490, partial [Nitrosarchaeum sp.]|nr:hypothetical protein [Nitrosarchaeum sp.]
MNTLTIFVLLSICFGVLSFGNALGHDDFTDYDYQNPTMYHNSEHKIIDKFLSWDIGKINGIKFSDHLTVNQDLENSIHFDRESDFMSFKPNKTGDISKISILVVVEPHFKNGNNMTVIEQEDHFSLTLNYNDGYHAEFSIFDGSQWISISSPVILNEKWTRIFTEFDGSSIKLLVNDVSLVEKQLNITNPIYGRQLSLMHNDHEIVLGASKSTRGLSNFYSGNIDEVQLYTTPTTEYSFGGTLDTFDSTYDQTSVEPINQTSVEPINQTPVEPINQTPVEPINQTSVEPINQTSVEPINQTSVEP